MILLAEDKKRILVVEDEGIVAMTLEDSLLNLGYEVAGTADDSRSAIELAEKEKPDLILMDIRLEDIAGIAAGNAGTIVRPDSEKI